ncbi:MAG: CpXC domain-containing protein [Anaerolineales bacterium]|nr:CpXC domain-containing protein [Anaerolineales bacterium]
MVANATQILCPNCRSPIQAQIQQLIDVGLDPGAKSRLLSGSFNHIQCGVCGFDGAVAAPLVYHDPQHELLLTFVPIEASMPKNEQERLIGQMIKRVSDQLPPEERKGYLFQPQTVLTMQGLIERVLEAEGITKEEIDAQRATMRLFEEVLTIPEEQIETFIQEHDTELDATFFQISSLALQSTGDRKAAEAMGARLEKIIEFSSFGKKLKAQEQAFKEATESLQALAEEGLTRETLLELLVEAPDENRVVALVNLTRPALDYNFFQLITERMDQAKDEEKDHLSALRKQILEITEELDRIQEARAAQSSALLKTLLDADDLDQALLQALPMIDDLFLGILHANLQAAEKREDDDLIKRFSAIEQRIRSLAQDSMPEGLKLAQRVLETKDEEEAMKLLEESKNAIDSDLLNALVSSVQQLEASDEKEDAARIQKLYKHALKLSMQEKMNPS